MNKKKIPNSFLENINIVNTASNFFKTDNNISDINTFYQTPYNNNFLYSTNKIPKYNKINIEKKNSNKKFIWKELNNINYNDINDNEKVLNNPLIKNILTSKLDEKEIQNIPEIYLVNLINTLQGLANNAIKEKNILEYENKKLYNDLEEIKINNEYLKQNNIKINKKLKKNENNNNIYMNININNKSLYKKRYYCKICTNKKFKTQKYLDEHIKRRHPDYINNTNDINNINDNINKNLKSFEKKLNDMKIHYENLIYKSLRKIQYIKLNEKINNLQDLIEITKNNKINNINNNQNNINAYIENKEIKIEEEYNEKEYLLLNNSNNNSNSNNNLKKINTNNTNNSISNNEKSEENNKKISKEELNRKRFEDDYMIIKKQIKFNNIKNFFKPTTTSITPQRKKKKTKTLKNISKLFKEEEEKNNNKINDINHLKKGKKKELNKNEKNKENEEDNNEINKNDNNIINNENINKKEEDDEEESLKSQNKNPSKFDNEIILNFSDKEESPKKNKLKKFVQEFKERDFILSEQKEENLFEKVYPESYQVDEEKVNEIIEQKINSKLKKYDFDNKNSDQIRTDLMQLYHEAFDISGNKGDIYFYFSTIQSNLIKLINIKSEIHNANDIEDPFENIQYQVEDDEDFSFGKSK